MRPDNDGVVDVEGMVDDMADGEVGMNVGMPDVSMPYVCCCDMTVGYAA